MGFYGGIKNTAKAPFTFDRIFSSRKAMELGMTSDGVYAGRYVLIEYDKAYSNKEFNQAFSNKTIDVRATDSLVLYKDSEYSQPYYIQEMPGDVYNVSAGDIVYITERVTNYIKTFYVTSAHAELIKEAGISTGNFYIIIEDVKYWFTSDFITEANITLKNYQVDNVVPTSCYAVYQAKIDGCSFYECTGPVSDTDNTALFRYVSTSTLNSDVPEGWANYYNNHIRDLAYYDDRPEGYDGTVWQKVYVDNNEKYIMVADLNAKSPTITVSADAPQSCAQAPHIDISSTKDAMDFHMPAQWGFRIKAADNSLSSKGMVSESEFSSEYTRFNDEGKNLLRDFLVTNNNIGTNGDQAVMAYRANVESQKINRYNKYIDEGFGANSYSRTSALTFIDSIITEHFADSDNTVQGIANFINDWCQILEVSSDNDLSDTPLQKKSNATDRYECFDITPAYSGVDDDTIYYMYIENTSNEIKFINNSTFTLLELIKYLLIKNFENETIDNINTVANLLITYIKGWIISAHSYWASILSVKGTYNSVINKAQSIFITKFTDIYTRTLNYNHTKNTERIEQFINFLTSIISDYEEQLYSIYYLQSTSTTSETYVNAFRNNVYNKYQDSVDDNNVVTDNLKAYLKDNNDKIADDTFVELLKNSIGILTSIHNAYLGLTNISNINNITDSANLEQKNSTIIDLCAYTLEVILNLSVLSDSNTQWITYYKDTPYYYDGSAWNTSDSSTMPADIFFNKDGFKPEIKTRIDTVEVMQDEILVTPSGYSQTLNSEGTWGNHKYNKEEGTIYGEKKEAPDVQEMSIHLPSIGNTISDVWDIVYGDGEEDSEGVSRRKTEIGWASDEEINYSNRTQWITPDENGGLGYTPENLATVAGVINSTQDLIGRNITVDPNGQTTLASFNSDSESVFNLDNDHIYYLSDEKQFYRRKWNYNFDYDFESDITTKDIYKDKVQGYEEIDLINPDNMNEIYFYKLGADYIWDCKYYSDKSYYTIDPTTVNFVKNNEYLLLEGENTITDNDLLIISQQVAAKRFSLTHSTDAFNWNGKYYSNDVVTGDTCYLFQDNKYYTQDSDGQIKLITEYSEDITHYYIKTKEPESIIDTDNTYNQILIENRGNVSYVPVPVRDLSEEGYEIYISQKDLYTIMKQAYTYYQTNSSWPFLLETSYTVLNSNQSDYDNNAKVNINAIVNNNLTGSSSIYYQVTYFKDLDLENDVINEGNSNYTYEFGKNGYFKPFDITQTEITKYEPGSYYYAVYNEDNTQIIQYTLDTSEGDSSRTYYKINATPEDFSIYKKNTYYYKDNNEYLLSTAPSSNEQKVLGYIPIAKYNELINEHPEVVIDSGDYLLQQFGTPELDSNEEYELAVPQPVAGFFRAENNTKWETYYTRVFNEDTGQYVYSIANFNSYSDESYYVKKTTYKLSDTLTALIYLDYETIQNLGILTETNGYITDTPYRYTVANPQPTQTTFDNEIYYIYSESDGFKFTNQYYEQWANENAYCVKEYLFTDNQPLIYDSLDYNYVLANTQGSFNAETAYWTANSEKTVFTPVLNPLEDNFNEYYVKNGSKVGTYDYYIIYKGQQGYNEAETYYIKNPPYYVTKDYLNYKVGQRWDASVSWDNYLLSTSDTYDANEEYYTDAFGNNKAVFYEKGKYYSKYEPNIYYIEDETKHFILDVRYKVAETQPTSQEDINNGFYYVKANNVVKAQEYEANTIYYLDSEATQVASIQPNEHNFYTYYIKTLEKAKIWDEDLNYVDAVGILIAEENKTFVNFQAGKLYLESFVPAVSYSADGVYYQYSNTSNSYELVNETGLIESANDFVVIDYYKMVRYIAKYNVDGQIYYVSQNNNDTTYLYTNNKFVYDRAYVYQSDLANNNKYYTIADTIDTDITYYYDRFGLIPVKMYEPNTYYIALESDVEKATKAFNTYDLEHTKFYLDDEGKENIWFEEWTTNTYFYNEEYNTYEYISKFDVDNGVQAYSDNTGTSTIDLLLYEPGKYYKEEYNLAGIYDKNAIYYLADHTIAGTLTEREFIKTNYYVQTATPIETTVYNPIIEYIDQSNYDYYLFDGTNYEKTTTPSKNEFYNGIVYYEKFIIPADYDYSFTREFKDNEQYYNFNLNTNEYEEIEVSEDYFGAKTYYTANFERASSYDSSKVYYSAPESKLDYSTIVSVGEDEILALKAGYYLATDNYTLASDYDENELSYYYIDNGDEKIVASPQPTQSSDFTDKENIYYAINYVLATEYKLDTIYYGENGTTIEQPTADSFVADTYYVINYVQATEFIDGTTYFIEVEKVDENTKQLTTTPTTQEELDAGTYYIINYIQADSFDATQTYYGENGAEITQPTTQEEFDAGTYYISDGYISAAGTELNSAIEYYSGTPYTVIEQVETENYPTENNFTDQVYYIIDYQQQTTYNATIVYYILNNNIMIQAVEQPTSQDDFDRLANYYYIREYEVAVKYNEDDIYYYIDLTTNKYEELEDGLTIPENLLNTYYYIVNYTVVNKYNENDIYYLTQNDNGIADPQPQSQEDMSIGRGYYVKTLIRDEQEIYQVALEWKENTIYYNKTGNSLGMIEEDTFNNRQKVYYSKSIITSGYNYTYTLATNYDANTEYYIKTSSLTENYQLVGKLNNKEFSQVDYYILEYVLDFEQSPGDYDYYQDNQGIQKITTAFWKDNQYYKLVIKTRSTIDSNDTKTDDRIYYYDEFLENQVYFIDDYVINKYYYTTLIFEKDTNEYITPYQQYYSAESLNSAIRLEEYIPAKFYILSEGVKYYRLDTEYNFDENKVYYLDINGTNISHIQEDYTISYDDFVPDAHYYNKVNNIYSPISKETLFEYEPRKFYWASDSNSQLIKNVRLISEKDLNSVGTNSIPVYKKFYLELMEGFSNSYNTISGLVLRVNQLLNSGDTSTRDLSTIQGALNTLEDEIRRLQAYDYATVYDLNETITNLKLSVKETIQSANALVSLLNSGQLASQNDLAELYNQLDENDEAMAKLKTLLADLETRMNATYTEQISSLRDELIATINTMNTNLTNKITVVSNQLTAETNARIAKDKVLQNYIDQLQEWTKNPTIPMPKPKPIPVDFWPVPARDPFHRNAPRSGHPEGRPWFRPHPRDEFKFDPGNPDIWAFDSIYGPHPHIHPNEPMPRPIPLPPLPEEDGEYKNIPITEVLYHLCMQNFFPFFAGAEDSANTGIGTGEKTDEYAQIVEDAANQRIFDEVRFSLVDYYTDIFSNFAITNDASYYDPQKQRVYIDIDISFKTKPGVKGLFGDYYGMPHGIIRLANGYTKFNLPAELEECALTISETTRSGRTYNARFIKMYNDTPGVIKISTNIDLEPNTLYTLHISGSMRCKAGY